MNKIEFQSYLQKNIDSAIEEFSSTSDRWTQMALESLYRSFDLQIRNNEREFSLLLSITTLSAAFLTIVVPLIKDSISILLILTCSLFLLTLILGITLLLLIIKLDKKWIINDSNWEHKQYSNYQGRTIDIVLRLRDYKNSPSQKLSDEIHSKYEEYINLRNKLGEEADSRKSQKDKDILAVTIKNLKTAFWVIVICSFASLIIWLAWQTITNKTTTNLNVKSTPMWQRREYWHTPYSP